MTASAIRLSLRLQRFEAFGIVAASVVAIAGALFFAARLDALHVPLSCFPGASGAEPTSECQSLLQRFYEITEDGRFVLFGLAGLPFLAGVVLGVPIVARELERGTTRLSWSLSPSRRAWFAARTLPVLAIVFLAAIGLALGAERLFAARSPDVDMSASFYDYGFRGPLLAARAIALFGVAVLIGTILGRALPALLLSVVAFAAVLSGVQVAHDAILEREAVYRPGDLVRPADRGLFSAFRLADGSVVRADWVGVEYHDDGSVWIGGQPVEWLQAVIPGERYGEVAGREAAAFGLIAVLGLGAALAVVDRRRPG